MKFFSEMYSKQDIPKYNFDAFYDTLRQTGQKAKLDELLLAVRTSSNESEKAVLGVKLNQFMNDLFADAGDNAISEFISEYVAFLDQTKAEFPLHTTEFTDLKSPETPIVNDNEIEEVIVANEVSLGEREQRTVSPRRFPPPEPIMPGQNR